MKDHINKVDGIFIIIKLLRQNSLSRQTKKELLKQSENF